jgi:hypothetical protein
MTEMVLVCAIVIWLDGINHCNTINSYLSTALQKQLQLFFWKMFKIQEQLVHVKFVHAQKLGAYLPTFVNLTLGINPKVA